MEVTKLLQRLSAHDDAALDELMPMVYLELKKLAHAHLRGKAGILPLETTSLVHEAYLRLQSNGHPYYESRAHFYGIASRVMRQVLVDSARARLAKKRGAGWEVSLSKLPDAMPQPDRSLIAVNDALRELEKEDPLKGRLIEMRFFGGLTAEESSAALSLPVNLVRRQLRLAQAWLAREISSQTSSRNTTSGGRLT